MRSFNLGIRFFPGITAWMFISIFCLGSGKLWAQDIDDIRKGKVNFTVNSNINLMGGGYWHWGIHLPRNTPYMWNVSGTLNVGLFGIQFPVSVNLGPQQRNFTQPFNQYGMSPYWKWVKVHLGWRTMEFSPYSVSGITFLGGGLELTPSIFRFGAFFGRLNKATPNDTANVYNPQSIYNRWGGGAKIGIGKNGNFCDLFMFMAKDDTNSTKAVNPVLPGKQNLVFGINGQVRFLKHFVFRLETVASAISHNISAPMITSPGWVKNVNRIFPVRIGSALLFAGQTSLAYQRPKWGLRLNYMRVDPDFASFGAMYRQGDIQSLTLSPNLILWKNRLIINGSVGAQQDNINGRKASTTYRLIGSANISFNPIAAYGLDFTFSNYGTTQRAGLLALNDTIRIAQNNLSFMLSQRYALYNKTRVFMLMLSAGYQSLSDLNRYLPGTGGKNINGNLSASWNRYKDNLRLMGGVNINRSSYQGGSVFLMGPSVSVGVGFLKNKMGLTFTGNYNLTLPSSGSMGSNVNTSLSWNYRITKTHALIFNTYFLQNNISALPGGQFMELRVTGGYNITLNYKHNERRKKTNS